jgi:uncharacterized protein YqcC (DUF446 family)
MFKEWNELFQHNLNLTVKMVQPLWLDTMRSDEFLKWMKLFHIYHFDQQEKQNQAMEEILEKTRIASKEDVKDLVDAQKLVIDLLEDITARIEKIENTQK